MRFYTFRFYRYARAVLTVCWVLINTAAIANGKEDKTDEVYVMISNNSESLLQLFKIIEKQFIYYSFIHN